MKIKQIIYGLIAVFISSCTGYTKKDGKVYLRSSNEARIGVNYAEVKNADYETFKVIDHNLNIDLALDKNHVFIDTSILENADPKTFGHVKDYYWKDKKNVYLLQFGRTDARIMGAEPTTFKVIKDLLWSLDKNNVYYEFDKLEKVTPHLFVAIDENWGKDNRYYYYQTLRVDSLDYESAEIIKSYFMNEPAKPSKYIKDKNHVFFHNKLVKDANSKTFKADGVGWFGHDDKYMFDEEKNKGLLTTEYKKTYIDKK
ncbi:DKNYY domain-containing protein [Flavobacterium algicola]|uniref:DKNYY domain-containing protein n=1 Tax=Flavobacterium algicola TaxID=556529 RepID=UPI001EFC86B8|nr:DKNYY domain-containing protein [Flavobacterium algicola]MCG9793814.1 DKNYY domain-containing protein [Flavobacterium algicola]